MEEAKSKTKILKKSKVEEMTTEIGIVVDGNFGNAPKMKVKQLNQKLRLYREFVLATLTAFVRSKKGGAAPIITACDPFAASGITGLQWKKHLKTEVHVSLADHDDLSKLISNTGMNDMLPTQMTLNSVRVPGDPFQSQKDNEVHLYQADGRTLLSMECFQFIYLYPFKNGCVFIESAFHSVSHGGLICFVVSDVSSFARSPHVIKRQYAANVIKTEYWKELAARTVLSSMAEAAARCNKGIIPQYVVSIEDYLLVCVKVGRSHARTEAALNQIAQLMHCRFCEERVFVETQLAPDDNPYSNLPCNCKQSNPGKTAVLLGPMWKGDIFNHELLCEIQQCGTDLHLSNAFTDMVSLLISESNIDKPITANDKRDINKMKVLEQRSNDEVCGSEITNGYKKNIQVSVSENCDGLGDNLLKRKDLDDINDAEVDVKKTCTDTDLWKDRKDALLSHSSNVPFYYNANNKAKSHNLPKLDKLISLLRKEGFLASRTHFDTSGIRTSATVERFLNVLSKD